MTKKQARILTVVDVRREVAEIRRLAIERCEAMQDRRSALAWAVISHIANQEVYHSDICREALKAKG